MLPLLKHDMQRKKMPLDIIKNDAEDVARAVENTIGPDGMYKMSRDGDIIPFGSEILNSMEKTPFMDLLARAAASQEKEMKDGTATFIYLAAMLLKRAFNLVSHGLHPTMVEEGYRRAAKIAIDELERIKKEVSRKEIDKIEAVIRDALAGCSHTDFLLPLIRNAVLFLKELDDENVKIFAEEEGDENESEIIVGHMLDYERKDKDMPESVDNARILILDEIKVRKPKVDAKIFIDSEEAYRKFADMDLKRLREIVDRIVKSGANVVFTKGEIDERAAKMLAKHGIMAFEKVGEEDIKLIARSTGAKPTTIDAIDKDCIGESGSVVDEDSGCAGGVCRVR